MTVFTLQAADVGWRFGDEIVAVNGKTVASREDWAIWPAPTVIKVSMLQNGRNTTWMSLNIEHTSYAWCTETEWNCIQYEILKPRPGRTSVRNLQMRGNCCRLFSPCNLARTTRISVDFLAHLDLSCFIQAYSQNFTDLYISFIQLYTVYRIKQ